MAEFQEFPKMARLSRDVVVTEKIDGTNAAVVIEPEGEFTPPECIAVCYGFAVYAQSRTRFVTPEDDNYGFAAWVRDHAADLTAGLGAGRHFGEFWGRGINRNYSQTERHFSLFNTIRWVPWDANPQPIPSLNPRETPKMQERAPACCRVVPVLYRGEFDTNRLRGVLVDLEKNGSKAAPGFMKPEGVVVFHTAGNVGFKKTLDKDDMPKSLATAAATV